MKLKEFRDGLKSITKPQHLLTIGVMAGFFFSIGFFGLGESIESGESATLCTQLSIILSWILYIGSLLLFGENTED
ncbi:MAG: hypothetical protein KAS32_31430 [Candidatus Peribacteraceae bacterium]|nr:hypothetical protein [Candidatus Peribacteraceae bacterium]